MATDSIKTTKRRYDTTGMSYAPKHDVYTKERLYELKRCQKSFAMSVAHPELDNTHLTGQQEMYGNIDAKQSAFDYLTQIVKEQHPTLIWHDVKSESGTLMERAMRTSRWLRRSIPSVVTSPAFCDDRYVIPADLVVVNDDGSYDVYHCSAKGFMNSTRNTEKKSAEDAFDDMAFLMLAVVRKHSKRTVRFHAVGIDGRYRTPYPDENGNITINPHAILHVINFDGNDPELRKALRKDYDLFDKANEIAAKCRADVTYAPEAKMGSQCNRGYTCPFRAWCSSQRCSDAVENFLPYYDVTKCKKEGIETMGDLVRMLEVSPTLDNMTYSKDGKTFGMGEVTLRELRTYLALQVESKGYTAAAIHHDDVFGDAVAADSSANASPASSTRRTSVTYSDGTVEELIG